MGQRFLSNEVCILKKKYQESPGCANFELLFIMRGLQLEKKFAIIIIWFDGYAQR